MEDIVYKITHHSGYPLRLDPEMVLVSGDLDQAENEAVFERLGLLPMEDPPGQAMDGGFPHGVLNLPSGKGWYRVEPGLAVDFQGLLAAVADSSHPFDWVAPVLRHDGDPTGSPFAYLPDAILLKMEADCEPADFESVCARFGLTEDEEKSRYLGAFRYCGIRQPVETPSFDILGPLMNEARVADARLETIPAWVPTAYSPSDPLFRHQWNMERVGAGGSGLTGWDISRGSPSVWICVLDNGCDLGHPDLHFLAEPAGINLATMAPPATPTGKYGNWGHGTACAGVAAGAIQNREGVAGLAGNCPVLPVAFETWTDAEVCRGVNFARACGVRVVSMSFGWNGWDPAIIDPAIESAFEAGMVLCVATHNDNGAIRYPATHSRVMAVGASDSVDRRLSPESPNGKPNVGSNYGQALSVVAPGVLIPTTDLREEPKEGDPDPPGRGYRLDFKNTSAATPHVSGLAALLLSVDPGLTNTQVRDIIESTAEKVGGYSYAADPDHPNGTWHEEMGYGRINVRAALEALRRTGS